MSKTENRLSRWSRLKSKGGADVREETAVAEDREKVDIALKQAEPEAVKLPGGVRVRNFVPAMAPLAPDAEDDDDALTRGVGHAPVDEASADSQVPAPVEEPEDLDTTEIFAGIEEEELTQEQQEIVSSLPPVESLAEGSDFTPFLADGVPEFIKRRALRMLWRASPFFNIRDGLNDYDEDFNIIHRVIDELAGNYKVGRGHLSEEELRDMMPEEARRAFDEDKEDDVDAESVEEGDDVAAADTPQKQPTTAESLTKAGGNDAPAEPREMAQADPADDDEIGEGDDDPDL